MSSNQDSKTIRKIALLAFGLNLLLALVKAMLAVISGSLAVTAGAIDSATDSVSSLAVFIGVNLSEKKTEKFPLGLYKIENVISVIVAIFIFFTGYEIAVRAFKPSSGTPDVSLYILAGMFFCTLATYLFGQYALKKGRETGSPTLQAEGKHRQADVMSSLIVLTSVTLNYFQVNPAILSISIDQFAACIVLIFIVKAGWELLSEGMRVLLDASIDSETLDRIKKIIKKHTLVTEVKNIVASNAGRFVFIQAEIELRTSNLEKAHSASEEIENNIRKEVPRVGRVTIHYEPPSEDQTRMALPVQNLNGKLSTKFGEAPYFAFMQLSGKKAKITEQNIQENPYKSLSKGRGIKVANWLIDHNVDQILLKEDIRKKGPGQILRNAGIKIELTDLTTLSEISNN
ncbi:MAG: cation diffusion facilitator family transporter [Desulfovibrionales bacterium]